jgi:hypothetical protein
MASHDANSGIYFRCLAPKKITDRTCYEANIFDERPDPSYGTGAITRYVEVSPMPKAGDKWNTCEVTANGRDITVVLNGQATAKLRNTCSTRGRSRYSTRQAPSNSARSRLNRFKSRRNPDQ